MQPRHAYPSIGSLGSGGGGDGSGGLQQQRDASLSSGGSPFVQQAQQASPYPPVPGQDPLPPYPAPYPSQQPYAQQHQQHQQVQQPLAPPYASQQAQPYAQQSLAPPPYLPQQQHQQPLPPYPAVPQPLPFSAPPERVAHGYDVLIYILQATGLPGQDWWNGLADPYCVVTTLPPGAQAIVYRTKTVFKSLNPNFDEFFELGNLPAGSSLMVEVWDKDLVTNDDIIGRAAWTFSPREMLPASAAGGGMLGAESTWGRLMVPLALTHPTKAGKGAGSLNLEICYRPSPRPGPPALLGPVRFRQHLSPAAGMFTGHWADPGTMAFSTYKLYLTRIGETFGPVRCPWNRGYAKAASIFNNPAILSMVASQHASLYATALGRSRGGVLSSAEEFYALFRNGLRGGERRYFTYTLMEDSLRCSETGAALFSDMMSKHAMHAGGADSVLYAGEFCIVPEAGSPGA